MIRPRAILTAAALVCAALVTVPAMGASATPTVRESAAPSVLAYLCGHAPKGAPCTVLVQRESGAMVLKVRDQAHRIHRFTTERAAMRYLAHRVPPCASEDSNACLWDARHRGNHRGDSFIVIGRGTTRDRSLPQYGHGVLVYMGELR